MGPSSAAAPFPFIRFSRDDVPLFLVHPDLDVTPEGDPALHPPGEGQGMGIGPGGVAQVGAADGHGVVPGDSLPEADRPRGRRGEYSRPDRGRREVRREVRIALHHHHVVGARQQVLPHPCGPRRRAFPSAVRAPMSAARTAPAPARTSDSVRGSEKPGSVGPVARPEATTSTASGPPLPGLGPRRGCEAQ
jgi:hypothetical protein